MTVLLNKPPGADSLEQQIRVIHIYSIEDRGYFPCFAWCRLEYYREHGGVFTTSRRGGKIPYRCQVGVPGVSWTVVKNLSLFEHVRQKSLCYAGFEILVKSLENTFVAEVFEGVSPDRRWW